MVSVEISCPHWKPPALTLNFVHVSRASQSLSEPGFTDGVEGWKFFYCLPRLR